MIDRENRSGVIIDQERPNKVLDDYTFAPIADVLWPESPDDQYWPISEISINQPGNIYIEYKGGRVYDPTPVERPAVTAEWISDVMQQLASFNGLPFSEDMPIVDCRLRGGHRFHGFHGFTNVRSGGAISIRVKRPFAATYDDFNVSEADRQRLVASVVEGKSILVSEGTSTGKTTFLNLLLKSVDPDLRAILVEDTPELEVPCHNQVGFTVSRSESLNRVTYRHIIDSSVRLRPDFIVAGEVSVSNAYPIMTLFNTGHSPFMSSIHANKPLGVFEGFGTRIRLQGFDDRGAMALLASNIDLIVQVGRIGGERVITDIVSPDDLPWRELEYGAGKMESEFEGLADIGTRCLRRLEAKKRRNQAHRAATPPAALLDPIEMATLAEERTRKAADDMQPLR